ncbi:MAG: zinc-dependent metalloprotease [Actinomycetaceae bacterium]|nr:zinc-dependent metalloprotease [Actinomycetaceae bacterium]
MEESENPREDKWKEMLRAIMGEEEAEKIFSSMKDISNDGTIFMSQPAGADVAHFIMAQAQNLFSGSPQGHVNWESAEKVAHASVNEKSSDLLNHKDASQATSALQTANLWLDGVCNLDPSNGSYEAWKRADAISHFLPVFKKITEPVAANVAERFIEIMREGMEDMPALPFDTGEGNMLENIMKTSSAALMGMQYGMMLASIAQASFGTSDTGIPLIETQTVALIPGNIKEYSSTLDIPTPEVELFVATREQACARLYNSISWIRPQIIDAVAAYANRIRINKDELYDIANSIEDPLSINADELQTIDLSNILITEPDDIQRAMLDKLVHLLSLIEGWVTTVCSQALMSKLPHTLALEEMFVRRNAENSPISLLFGNSIGLSVTPRQMREAVQFWKHATEKLGIEERDRLWNHPDLLPSPEHLSNPETFFTPAEPADIDKEIDALLADILSQTHDSQEDSDNESQNTSKPSDEN